MVSFPTTWTCKGTSSIPSLCVRIEMERNGSTNELPKTASRTRCQGVSSIEICADSWHLRAVVDKRWHPVRVLLFPFVSDYRSVLQSANLLEQAWIGMCRRH